MTAETRTGLMFAVAANTIWGLFPIYWQLLSMLPAAEILCHRIFWGFAFSLVIAAVRFRYSPRVVQYALIDALRQRQTWTMYGLAGVLVAINWLAFLWAVTNGYVLLSALGYYINPLMNVLLGVIVLGERLPAAQWTAVALAAVGVSIMTVATGQVPWVSLVMATSFAGYALVKKKSKLDAMNGLFLETLILVTPTIVYLTYLGQNGQGAFAQGDVSTDFLLVLGGFLTLVPLALFTAAAQRAPLSLIGILQYVGPTLQFLVGKLYFGEELPKSMLLGFGFVWIGVIVFLLSGIKRTRRIDERIAAAGSAD